MKKLPIFGGILVLFAVWLNTLPQDHSDIPELLSLIFAISGVILGTVSLFLKGDK